MKKGWLDLIGIFLVMMDKVSDDVSALKFKECSTVATISILLQSNPSFFPN